MIAKLKQNILDIFSDREIIMLNETSGELTAEVNSQLWFSICQKFKENKKLNFEMCMDLCGVDYLLWGKQHLNAIHNTSYSEKRFGIIIHLLSIKWNWRVRVKTRLDDNNCPSIQSLFSCWPSTGWFEREAFDLFGIKFIGHPDLRRILTDYGFIGYPFRKDFPISGKVEMHFDEKQGRVTYRPVQLPDREITPKIIREDFYENNE